MTYHGPGQLVLYTLLDIQRRHLGVKELVRKIEQAIINLLAEFGIEATGREDAPGVYVTDAKIAALGLRVKQGRTYHGLALNVNTSLEPFSWIHPCGLSDIGMTSLGRELSREVSMSQVRSSARHNIESVFGVQLVMKSLAELKAFM